MAFGHWPYLLMGGFAAGATGLGANLKTTLTRVVVGTGFPARVAGCQRQWLFTNWAAATSSRSWPLGLKTSARETAPSVPIEQHAPFLLEMEGFLGVGRQCVGFRNRPYAGRVLCA
jgi:hypothetical protein